MASALLHRIEPLHYTATSFDDVVREEATKSLRCVVMTTQSATKAGSIITTVVGQPDPYRTNVTKVWYYFLDSATGRPTSTYGGLTIDNETGVITIGSADLTWIGTGGGLTVRFLLYN